MRSDGVDGLAGIHTTVRTVIYYLQCSIKNLLTAIQHSHFTPDETWKALFDPSLTNQETGKLDYAHELSVAKALFRPSHKPAHQEILSLLRQNEPDTITIVAIGPLTNLALAAAEDPETFLRAKEVVVMGGAIGIEGNVTPVAEFNTFADAIAAARVFALTSPSPNSTVPPMRSVSIDGDSSSSSDVYPKPLSKQLNLTLLPLDITNSHLVGAKTLAAVSSSLVKAGSPLATFVHAFLGNTFAKISEIEESPEGMSLHDPLCIWYVITRGEIGWKFAEGGKEDIRVETMGQWTRGQCILDRRTRKKATSEEEEVVGDHGSWLSLKKGNRLNRIVETGVRETFGAAMLTRIFGPTAA